MEIIQDKTGKPIEKAKSVIKWKLVLLSYLLFAVLSACLLYVFPSSNLAIFLADIGTFFTLIMMIFYLLPKAIEVIIIPAAIMVLHYIHWRKT
ncbi:MAG: hypothetical protein IPL53_06715 [Ignavibacteria bacterium]|nr:hypothetical protein [Ignavibacteria bacterium]